MTGSQPPRDPAATAQTGPWTVHTCVTASCTRCGTTPRDEDTGLTPHFGSATQAREELTRDWGWHRTARSSRNEQEVLLCPACAAAEGDDGNPGPPSPDAGGGQGPGAAPWWERPGDPRRELPANTASLPAAGVTREEG